MQQMAGGANGAHGKDARYSQHHALMAEAEALERSSHKVGQALSVSEYWSILHSCCCLRHKVKVRKSFKRRIAACQGNFLIHHG
jgi:hypothetical protein